MKADFEKGTKVCSKCKKELPIEMFGKDNSRSDKLCMCCKNCRKTNIITNTFDKINVQQMKDKIFEEYKNKKEKLSTKFNIYFKVKAYVIKQEENNDSLDVQAIKVQNELFLLYLNEEREAIDHEYNVLQKEINDIEWYIHWKKCYNPKISEYKRQRIKYLYECGESLYNICVMCDCELADIYVVCGGFRIVKE